MRTKWCDNIEGFFEKIFSNGEAMSIEARLRVGAQVPNLGPVLPESTNPGLNLCKLFRVIMFGFFGVQM